MKRLILWWLATCTAAAVTGQPKQALTFDQALEMTMTRNPELEAISYEKETAEKERKAAYGLRLPKASVTGAYIYMGDDMAIDMNDLKAPVGGVLEGLGNLPNIPPAILQQASSLLAKDWSMKLQDRSFANVGANITLPLYTGGKINAANNAAKIKIEEVAEKGNQTRGSLVSELTERYYGLVLALQVVEVYAVRCSRNAASPVGRRSARSQRYHRQGRASRRRSPYGRSRARAAQGPENGRNALQRIVEQRRGGDESSMHPRHF